MNGVAAKIAQKIRVLLEDRHFDAGTGQQEPKHHSGGSAPGNAAGSGQFARTVVAVHQSAHSPEQQRGPLSLHSCP